MKHLFVLFLGLLLFIVGCKKNNDTQPEPVTAVSFSPGEMSISTGHEAEVELVAENLPSPFFALTMSMSYDTSIVSFSDTSGWTAGNLFSSSAIAFVHADSSIIGLALTCRRGTVIESGSGSLGRLRFIGIAAGSDTIRISTDKFHLYDSTGVEIDHSGVSIGSAIIRVN